MSSNKKAKEELIRLYGAECFIEKLKLRKDKNRKYTSKSQMKKMKQLTYHHIIERKNGGKATVENGAILSIENHEWFNKQTKEKQEEMNKIFQDYKIGIIEFTTEETKQIKEIALPEIKEDYIEIPVYDFTEKDYLEYKKKRNEKVIEKFEER